MIIAGLSDFLVGDLTDWVVDVIDRIGYLGVALLVSVENVFPPIPSEVVLPAAGLAASRGQANLIGMVVAATVGSVIGAWALYLISAAIGHVRLEALVVKYGRWLGVRSRDLDRAESWFDDHSSTAVLVCRCIPLIRSLVSIPAGFRRMNPVSFTLYTALGSLLWNVVLIGAGYQLGDRWEKVGEWVGTLQYLIVALIAAFAAYWVWTRFISKTHRERRRQEDLQYEAEADRAERILDATD
ncbi:MAG TPA: DedA family protein [Aquihabitans sp.]|jgi:membrane protein DedA with SNARE-associated domain|nr:DedA family protein [Aquihabitans sp.]